MEVLMRDLSRAWSRFYRTPKQQVMWSGPLLCKPSLRCNEWNKEDAQLVALIDDPDQ